MEWPPLLHSLNSILLNWREMEAPGLVKLALEPPVKDVVVPRQSAGFHPSVWGDYFIMHPASSAMDQRQLQLQRVELNHEVKHMLKVTKQLPGRMKLVDGLQRLGIDYHFRDEIHEALQQINNAPFDANDLHLVALRFQLLRQQGYNEQAEVFNKFKDSGGKFSANKSFAARGLLSLYEASCLATRDEEILDEAMDFTEGYLKSMMSCVEPWLAKQIENALETPFHRGMRRLETRNYISIYEGEEDHCSELLELAKLDFECLQSLHQAEIREISLWWKEQGFAQNLHFIRDRLVECYFWILGVYYEPQHSWSRIQLTKLISLATVMDDIFDVYGTIEELESLTDVMQRWDFQDIDRLPDYMKIFFHSLVSNVKEIAEGLPMGRQNDMDYIVEMIKGMARAYLEEAKWASKNHMPSLEEYLHVSVTSGGYPMLICGAYILMRENVTQEAIDWMVQVPKIVEASALILRLMNDIMSSKHEQERKHVASSVQCYMNEHHVSEQEACRVLQKMIADAWKDINKECLNQAPTRWPILMLASNFARMSEVLYRDREGFTESSGKTTDQIASLLIHPFKLQK